MVTTAIALQRGRRRVLPHIFPILSEWEMLLSRGNVLVVAVISLALLHGVDPTAGASCSST